MTTETSGNMPVRSKAQVMEDFIDNVTRDLGTPSPKAAREGTAPTEAEREASKAARARLLAREQERAARPPREVWEHVWEAGGAKHRLTATAGALRYRRSDVPGLIEVSPDDDGLPPLVLPMGALEMIGGVAEAVAELGAKVHAKLLCDHADSFREANRALEADGAPPVQTLHVLVGALVRTLRERREYAESYRGLAASLANEGPLLALAKALSDAGDTAEGDAVAVRAERTIRRLLGASWSMKGPNEDLSKALSEAGETSGGVLPVLAAQTIRRLLATIADTNSMERVVLLIGDSGPDRVRFSNDLDFPVRFIARQDDCPMLHRLHNFRLGEAVARLCAMVNDAQSAEPDPTRAPFDYMRVLSMIGSAGDVGVPGRYRVPIYGKLPITFSATEGDRAELRALDREQLGPALSKLCRMFNDEEHAAHAESVLANTTAQFEDAVGPARQDGETVLGCVQRLVAGEITRHAEAYDRGEFLGSPLPSERERIVAAEKVHERTMKNVALCHATLVDAVKLTDPGLDFLDAGALRRDLAAAMACLETLPFTPHVEGPDTSIAPSIGEEKPAPVPVPRRHLAIIGSSKTACRVQLLMPISGPSWAADEIDSVMVRWSTDVERVTCPECIEIAAIGPMLATARKLDPVFDWPPSHTSVDESRSERRCVATYDGLEAKGHIRRSWLGGPWSGFANGFTMEPIKEVGEVDAMRWVMDRLKAQLVAMAMERDGEKLVAQPKAPAYDHDTSSAKHFPVAPGALHVTAKSDADELPAGSSR